MCGIAGAVFRDRPDPNALADLGRMVSTGSHRGPDAQGLVQEGPAFLGHSRLSILDRSPNASQPMSRNGVTIVFNGEIYNFLELAEELRDESPFAFESHGDTEVLLAA